ncbi:receptor-like protein EIX1 [Physcomitrium patens]|uniref:Leucine-rich repeat-containing N-terminal plant-type domain-containing protein n=1 Tax=Physcomitrium patens TaxID=3218 RepID=A0A2K1KWH1_PHYPA|nr:hypothetical protein PHYPA_005116 [Physcomitrium patens]
MVGNGRRMNRLVAFLVVVCSAVSGCRAWDCSAADKQTLLDFKNGFVDTNGVFNTWSDSTVNCCAWKGITCRESDGAILEINIVGSSGTNQQPYRSPSYQGTVGAGLVALTQLQKLKIEWVLFNGPIPQQWGDFSTTLVLITINNANLRNDIPSTLVNIQNLRHLDLKNNHLTGSIPSTFCTHKKINYIDVSYNDMTYLLVPPCLVNQNNLTVIFDHQGNSTSPGYPAAGSTLTVSSLLLAIGALTTALLFL